MIIIIKDDQDNTFETVRILDAVMLHERVGPRRVADVVYAAIMAYVERVMSDRKLYNGLKERKRAIQEMVDVASESDIEGV